MAVHRIIEANAARYGDAPAISDQQITLSYRELNQRANVLARHLIAQGFRRGAVATVSLPRSAETAIVLLGILKAGGTYAFMDDDSEPNQWPRGVSLVEKAEGTEVRYRTVCVAASRQRTPESSANLPILARGSDVACVIPDRDGSPLVLVPHATIVSLQQRATPQRATWSREAGALDLWTGLMNGATVTLSDPELRSAA